MRTNGCAVPERPGTSKELEERCRKIERMLRERDPGEGFEWPTPDEPEHPDPPKKPSRG